MKDVTVIITLWRRNHLEEQLQALVEQTLPPSQIWLIQNENHVDFTDIICKFSSAFPGISHFRLSTNLKFYIRFSFALNVSTNFTMILDDDIIPGRRWLEVCTETEEKFKCIVCPTGRIIPPSDISSSLRTREDFAQYKFGDSVDFVQSNYNDQDVFVDYGCNSYFFDSKVIRSYWQVWPNSFEDGDDIHLSAVSKIILGIPTVVPSQKTQDACGNVKRSYGSDYVASWRRPNFDEDRNATIKRFVHEKGWIPLCYKTN